MKNKPFSYYLWLILLIIFFNYLNAISDNNVINAQDMGDDIDSIIQSIEIYPEIPTIYDDVYLIVHGEFNSGSCDIIFSDKAVKHRGFVFLGQRENFNCGRF